MDFIIAIPTYKRQDTLKEKTLKFLKVKNIPSENIFIFVADEEEKEIYNQSICKDDYNKIVVGVKGILNQRHFIIDYFNEGKYIVSIDDDIDDIKELTEDNKLESVNLLKLIQDSFKLIKQHNLTFWGITMISNKTWMKQKINTNLGIAPAGFYGFINDKTMKNKISNFSREDVERSIHYFNKEGALMRYQNIMMKTKMKKGDGGIQADYNVKERQKQEELYNIELMNHYPEYISSVKTKVGIKLKNIKSKIKIDPTPERIKICNHPENKLCSYVATFDDWFFNTWKEMAKYANSLKIPLTLFVNTASYYYEIYSINIKSSSKGQGINVKKETQELLKSGNEIGYHTCNHIDMKKSDEEYIKKDIDIWKKIMMDDDLIIDEKAVSGAYPYGNLPKKLDLIKKHFISMRGTGYGLTNKPTYNTKTINIGQKTSIQKLNKELNKAIETNSTMIISGHSMNGEGWSPIPQNILYDHWKSIDHSKVACMTYQDYVKYHIQKENMIIKSVGNKIIIEHTLDFKLVPIYIDVGHKIFYQGGKKLNTLNGILKIDNFNQEITEHVVEEPHFVIAIPSYKRHKTLNKKTLQLLRDDEVPKELIYIFVADEEEEKLYKDEIGCDYKIIIGRHTLKGQRNFINDYFDVGQNIICLDDDLETFITGYKEKEEVITLKNEPLINIFKKGFEDSKKIGAYIFGFYPVPNRFFMKQNTTTYNQYIIGSAYGYINRRIKVNTDDKEDVERSLQHFVKDGKTLRYNHISFKTKYYTEKGGLQETRTLQTIQQGAEYVNQIYPSLTKIKIKKNGRYEIEFNRQFKYTPIDTPVKRYPIPSECNELINTIYEKIKKTTLPTIKVSVHNREINKKRKKIPRQERGDKLIETSTILEMKKQKFKIGDQTLPRSLNVGFGNRRGLGSGILNTTHSYRELFELLVELGKKIIPSYMTFNAITINQNILCKKHKDAGNCGPSVFFTIGEFSGGGLYVEDILYSNCNQNITIFDGALKEHYTEDFIGNRYSFIFYNVGIYKCPEEHLYKGELIVNDS
jgi:hypothetical protein